MLPKRGEPTTVAELRAECKRRGLRKYSKLKKDELVRMLQEASDAEHKEPSLHDLTVQQLRAECQLQGVRGYSKLKKEDIVRRLEDRAPGEALRGFRARAPRRSGRGPLQARAQEIFDAGPTPLDTPGYLYIYYDDSNSSKDEWKIGKTTLNPPERRMHQSAEKNGKVYKARKSWFVPWCGYTERIVHADLDDFRVVPPKERADGTETEDGGTEWFRGNIATIEARVVLALRMVRARAADEACGGNSGCFVTFCGIFGHRLHGRRCDSRSDHNTVQKCRTTSAAKKLGSACDQSRVPAVIRC